MRGKKFWVWGLLALVPGVVLTAGLLGENKTMFLVGQTSDGHHQIERDCGACHTRPFGGAEALQKACIECHGDELNKVKDSHPKSKFTDPRNAERVALLDARLCVTCHREHQPRITRAMGVTLPEDFCFLCHSDIGKNRPSHRDLSFSTCADSGCHNFHDNKGLYEDFLTEHLEEPDILPAPRQKERNLRQFFRLTSGKTPVPLDKTGPDSPPGIPFDEKLLNDWERTAHARSGINCSECHTENNPPAGRAGWVQKSGTEFCKKCHEAESKGFFLGKHGMRPGRGLSPMTPGRARLPMKENARDKELLCTACHGAHAFDTAEAAVEACLGCHDDGHSRAYKNSPHYRLWKEELSGKGLPNTGVSCATCHMPREFHRENGFERVAVQHNQNKNLRPNEKMIRGVCLSCHGLGFSLDALADPEQVRKNFDGRPAEKIKSLEWAEKRLKEKPKEERRRAGPPEGSLPGAL